MRPPVRYCADMVLIWAGSKDQDLGRSYHVHVKAGHVCLPRAARADINVSRADINISRADIFISRTVTC